MIRKLKKEVVYLLLFVFIFMLIPTKVFAIESGTSSSTKDNTVLAGTYVITSKQSNKVIEVANYGKDNGDLIQQSKTITLKSDDATSTDVEVKVLADSGFKAEVDGYRCELPPLQKWMASFNPY